MATKQPPYEAVVDLCGRLNVPVPHSPMPDSNGDREEEPVPSLSTSTIQRRPLTWFPFPLPTYSIVAFFLITPNQHSCAIRSRALFESLS